MPDSDLDIVLSGFDSGPSSMEEVQRSRRWDNPFGKMTHADVVSVLASPPFKRMCPDLASAKKEAFISYGVPISVYGILKNDARIRNFSRGEFVLRRGDYSNSAYFLLEGALRNVGRPHLDDATLGRKSPVRCGFLSSLANRLHGILRPTPPEYRKRLRSSEMIEEIGTRISEAELAEVLRPKAKVAKYDLSDVRPGNIFGEMGAIYRSPSAATVIAEETSRVLEIRWQGLRDLMDIEPSLAQHIQDSYRRHHLRRDLENNPHLTGLSDAQLGQIHFKTYGKYDEWSSEYLLLSREDRSALIDTEEIIAREGDYPNGVYIVRAGFARESRKYGHGHRTLNYLTTGQMFGLREILYNGRHRKKDPVPFQHSLRAIGYAHVLFVPTVIVDKHIIPRMTDDDKRRLLENFHPVGREDDAIAVSEDGEPVRVPADLIEFLVERRLLNGTQSMMIDLDRCTRCDDCVRACEAAHEGNPRFVRHGPIQGKFMLANACMHCADPVCMIGCPTGAIHRESFAGYVVINEETCIGCATCYSNCPYDAIRMTAVRDSRGEFSLVTAGEQEGSPIYKATKCDLCVDQSGGPACVRACPHDALRRVNMQDMNDLASFVNA